MRMIFLFTGLLFFGLACSTSQGTSSSTTPSAVTEVTTDLDSLIWTTNMKAAKKIAKTNDLKILMVFSGSDWCLPCQQFKKEVLVDEAFAEVVKDQIVILYLDFPAKKRNMLPKKETAANVELAERYNSGGTFPTILLLPGNENTNPCELNYKGDGPEVWIAKIDEAIERCSS